MASLSPETHAAREKRILDITRRLLRKEGPQGLTMDRVQAHLDFSKGTLYKHFASREDLLLAFITEEFRQHRPWFERAALFRGKPRERFMAMGLAAGLADQTLGCEDLPPTFIADQEVYAKASQKKRDAFQQEHGAALAVFHGVVRDGISCGDLPCGTSPDLVVNASWSLHLGAGDLFRSRLILPGQSPQAFAAHLDEMFLRLLDGFGWRPLSTQWDYASTGRRVLSEVFPEEAGRLGLT
jgi:AcrR family transcriptional regulator